MLHRSTAAKYNCHSLKAITQYGLLKRHCQRRSSARPQSETYNLSSSNALFSAFDTSEPSERRG